MATMQWDPSMATGVDTVDSHHKQLIAWLNDLLAAMSQGRGRAEIADVLDKLGNYTVMHFGYEEECMIKYKCPVAAQNAEAHKEFIATFRSFQQEFDQNGASAHLVVRIESELMRWLTNHIKRTDTNLKPCVHGLV
jgi:hemerythrin